MEYMLVVFILCDDAGGLGEQEGHEASATRRRERENKG